MPGTEPGQWGVGVVYRGKVTSVQYGRISQQGKEAVEKEVARLNKEQKNPEIRYRAIRGATSREKLSDGTPVNVTTYNSKEKG